MHDPDSDPSEKPEIAIGFLARVRLALRKFFAPLADEDPTDGRLRTVEEKIADIPFL